MELQNPLYKNIGAHAIINLFTVEKGIIKVLLIKRSNEPYKNMWALVSGALYNNELIIDGALRELNEKTGIINANLELFKIFDKIDRSPLLRMYGFSFIGVIDSSAISFLKNTKNTNNADWFSIDDIPTLAYDHNEILNEAIITLRKKIVNSDILKSLFPNGFTIPEIHKVYESILNIKIDRRNFRKKLVNFDFIRDTNKMINFNGKKPAKLYEFSKDLKNETLF